MCVDDVYVSITRSCSNKSRDVTFISGHVEEVHVQELRDVRQAGAGAPGGPAGAGERELRAGAGRDSVGREVRRGRGARRRIRPRLLGSVRPVLRGQAGPVLRHVDAERQAAGRSDGAVGPEVGRGHGRRVRSLGRYCTLTVF